MGVYRLECESFKQSLKLKVWGLRKLLILSCVVDDVLLRRLLLSILSAVSCS